MPNTTQGQTTVTTQQNKTNAVDFVIKMQQIIAARRLEEIRSNLGV